MIRDTNIVVDQNKCLACGNCVDRCIMDNLRLSTPPCRWIDPLGVNWQGIFRFLALDQPENAARELRRFTPFAAFLTASSFERSGKACSRKRVGDEPLDFGAAVSWLVENFPEIVWSAEPVRKKQTSVAIQGLSVQLLQAAYDLSQAGYNVDIFLAEESPRPDLPENLLEKAFAMLESLGARIIRQAGMPENPGKTYHARIKLKYDTAITDNDADNIFFASSPSDDVELELAKGSALARKTINFLDGFPLDYEADRHIALGLEHFQGMDLENVESSPLKHEPGKSLDKEQIKEEAQRCLACGRPFEKNQTCWYCLPCEVVCPTKALSIRIPYLIR